MAKSGDLEKVSLAMNKVSQMRVQVVEEEGEVKTGQKVDRHCAFCLTLVPGAEVKLCSKCKRRAYCSKECQTADWKLSKNGPAWNGKIHGYGQGHKNWCGLPYGEEDLDWRVAPISGKGLGLVALRDLPPLYRILVDGIQPMPFLRIDNSFSPHHPGMDDLDPPPGQHCLVGTFRKNAAIAGTLSKIGLRLARTNHSCDPNAFPSDDEQFHVLILCSNREIKEGEEICLSYAPANDFPMRKAEHREKPPEYFRNLLFTSWEILCPPSCPCRDLEKVEMLKMCKKLYWECLRDHVEKNVLSKMEKVIEIAGKVGCSASTMCVLYYGASQCARTSLETTKEKDYLEKHLEVFKAIYHPNNKQTLERENDLKAIVK